MSMIGGVFDGLQNLIANLGTSRDKSSGSEYVFSQLSMLELTSAYRGSWLPKKIVNIPANDAVRRWRTWSAGREQVDKIELTEKHHQVRQKVRRAKILARLTGGAAVYIGMRNQDSAEPLEADGVRLGDLEYLTVFSRYELNAGDLERDIASEYYGRPSMYTVHTQDGVNLEIHPSRLVIMHGEEVLDETINGAVGWGDSVLQSVYRTLLDSDQTTASIASLIFEAKIDVIKIPGLMTRLSEARYEQTLLKRFGLAMQMKGINGALALDEKEEYLQKSASFAGLPDVMDRFMQNVSGASDIPLTRLWGRSPSGMNATGESDMRNYYDSVQAHQELVLSPAMSVLDDVIVASSLGSIPDEIYPEWDPLWQMSEEERAKVGETTARTIKTLAEAKVFPDETLTAAASTSMIETGALPGLDSAVEDHGLEREEDGADDLIAAALARPQNQEETRENPAPVADATPRTLHVRRDVLNADAVVRWAHSQGLEEITDASEMHVTIAFSREPVDWMQMGESFEERIEIAAGGPRAVEDFGTAVVLLVPPGSLRWRHREMREAGASWDHDEYQPHVTLSVSPQSVDLREVEPYQGRIVLGPEIFEEISRG